MREAAEIAIAVIIIVGRVMSHFEHKKTGKTVNDIKVFINGQREKDIEKAREEGRQEERNKK